MAKKQAESNEKTGGWVHRRGYVPVDSGKEPMPPKGGSGVSSIKIQRDASTGRYVEASRTPQRNRKAIKK